jgi:hypothetical protein
MVSKCANAFPVFNIALLSYVTHQRIRGRYLEYGKLFVPCQKECVSSLFCLQAVKGFIRHGL